VKEICQLTNCDYSGPGKLHPADLPCGLKVSELRYGGKGRSLISKFVSSLVRLNVMRMTIHLNKNPDNQKVTFTMLTTTDGSADKVKIDQVIDYTRDLVNISFDKNHCSSTSIYKSLPKTKGLAKTRSEE